MNPVFPSTQQSLSVIQSVLVIEILHVKNSYLLLFTIVVAHPHKCRQLWCFQSLSRSGCNMVSPLVRCLLFANPSDIAGIFAYSSSPPIFSPLLNTVYELHYGASRENVLLFFTHIDIIGQRKGKYSYSLYPSGRSGTSCRPRSRQKSRCSMGTL